MVDKKRKKEMDREITNTLLDDIDKFEHFLIGNWRRIVFVAVGIVIAVAIFAVVSSVMASADKKAVNAIAGAVTADEIEKALKEYPNHRGVASAHLRLADIFLKDKRYADALEQYKELTRIVGVPEEMLWRARLSEAYMLELQDEKSDAASKFAEIGANKLLPVPLRYEAGYAAGRLYVLLDKVAKAKELLEQIDTALIAEQDVASKFWATQAQSLLIRLNSGT